MNVRHLLPWLAGALMTCAASVHAALDPVRLRCEYLDTPLAVQSPQPRLSWIVESSERGQVQTAYRILAASTRGQLEAGGGDLWDSSRVPSAQSVHVAYGGTVLRSRQPVFWKVRVWDRDGRPSRWSRPAFWRMGLLQPEDWQAQWIATPHVPAPVVRPNYGFLSRSVKTADTNQWVVVDLRQPQTFDRVRLFPAHPYPHDPSARDYLFPRRLRIEAGDDAAFARVRVLADCTAHDLPAPGCEPLTLAFAPATARHVRLHVTRLARRGGPWHGFALAEFEVLRGSTNLALHAPVSAPGAARDGTWSETNLVDGVVVSQRGGPATPMPAPLFRKAFVLDQPARHATVYATALGLYELRLNGRRVGDHRLAPEWTDYGSRIQYQAYDVTRLLRRGDNVLGALLGEGWFAGRIGMSDGLVQKLTRVYGEQPRLLVQLEIDLADGTRQTVATDPTWRATLDGPIRQNDLLDGETHDARRELPGWDQPRGEPPGAWGPVTVVPPPTARLVAQPNEPVRATREVQPVALTEPLPGVHVFDLGQNLVGHCRLQCRGPAGTTVTLRHAEMLNEDGTLYIANLRGAPQTDRYTLRGAGREVFEPRFTCHGFRFVEVTGLPRGPHRGDLTAIVVHSAAPETATFECSDARLNRLWQNIRWTQRANLVSVPTDCPQRDERLGWMGDIQAFAQTALFNMNLGAFLTKWLQDVRDAQADDGRFPDFAPHPYGRNSRFTGAPAWADAGVIVPWQAYVNYGDRRLLETHFESARRWVDFVHAHNPDHLWRTNWGNAYGDWLNGDTIHHEGWPDQGGAIPKDVFATAFHAHTTDLVSRMAAVLDQPDDAARYADRFRRIQTAFQRAFVQPDGRIQGDTQAGYALALHFDLLPDALRPAALDHLHAALNRYHGHLSSGIQTTHRLLLELAREGRVDTAWQILTNRTFPSWYFTLDQGATTIWERWDGYVPARGFQDRAMNSFNHWALGAVGEWIMREIAGLHPDPAQPGFRHFLIRPRPGGGVAWMKASHQSIRGRIAWNWTRDSHFDLALNVPANTTATVWLPANAPAAVREGRTPLLQARGVQLVETRPAAVVVRVGAGSYRFRMLAAPGG
ncbi:MAG: family 78 glycoside hydrolase catalytic domain [Verrucomicrobia bacterium]|nr:family 78 glycoside hydrolase catalytic domain [Verrucomicrobiota bacterium]